MKILFFTKGDRNTASSRQRAFLMAEEIAKKGGIETVMCTPPINTISETSWPKKGRLIFAAYKNLREVKPEDIIFLQRAIQNKYFFAALIYFKIFFRRKIILDLDDAIYLHSPYKTKIVTYIADAVIAGSHSIIDWAKKYNKNVYLIPTGVRGSDYEKFSSTQRERNKQFTIGWIGNGPAHYENLRMLAPVFTEIAAWKPGFLFRLVGALGDKKIYELFNTIDGMQVEIIDSLDWGDQEAIPRAIQGFDIGLMPLEDSEWNRGKCAFKAIEYMASSIPVVISRVGENVFLVDDGENGMLAVTTEEWVAKIKLLYTNQPLRERMGERGKEKVKADYSLSTNAKVLLNIINSL
ncbi:MAG: glycosyltransferase family 4 protein [Minisyncoccota bacterium]